MLGVFESYKKSLERLCEIMKAEPTLANRDSAIQRFEITYELAWKSLQKYLRSEGLSGLTPKKCFMEAFKIGVLKDNPDWMQMSEDRNTTSHIYNEELSEKIYKRIDGYILLFDNLKEGLNKK